MERNFRRAARLSRAWIAMAACVAAGTGAGAAPADPYKTVSDREAGFQCDVPKAWSPGPGKGLFLLGPAGDDGFKPSLGVRFYKDGDDFSSAQDYITAMTGNAPPASPAAAALLGGKAAPKPSAPAVELAAESAAGIEGSRFEVPEKYVREHAPPGKRPRGPLRLRHAHVVLPVQAGFWVLRYTAVEKDYKRLLPHFERLIRSFKPAKPAGPAAP